MEMKNDTPKSRKCCPVYIMIDNCDDCRGSIQNINQILNGIVEDFHQSDKDVDDNENSQSR